MIGFYRRFDFSSRMPLLLLLILASTPRRTATAFSTTSAALNHVHCRSTTQLHAQQVFNHGHNNNNNNTTATELELAGAPFVRYYPRHVVDLSRVASLSSQKSDSSFFWNQLMRPFSGAPQSAPPRSFHRKLQRRFPDVMLQTIIATSGSNDNNFPTCHAMSQLWRAATATQQTSTARVVLVSTDVGVPFQELLAWAAIHLHVPLEAQCIRDDNENNKNDQWVAVYLTSTNGTSLPSTTPLEQQLCLNAPITLNHPDDNDPDVIHERTRAWVQRLLVEQGICPFTKHSRSSGQGLKPQGIPVGRIAYHASVLDTTNVTTNTTTLNQLICPLLADTWEAMYDMLVAGPNGQEGGISSILLAAPAFDEHLDVFAGPFFSLLEASVWAAQAQEWLGVVCFHPRYAVSDGTSWPGFGHMHSVTKLTQWMQNESNDDKNKYDNDDKKIDSPPPLLTAQEIAAGGAWQRRTPHATINVLRADQLAAAEQVRSSHELYPRNIRVLQELGWQQLWNDLERERNLGSS